VLSEGERARFARVIRPRQRERLIVARAALRAALASYLRTAPVEVHIERGPGGKPRLSGDSGLAFNMSHSGALAVIAVTRRAAVGVDVELLGRALRPGVIRRALAPAELEVVQAVAEEHRGEAFLRHWTAKEAYGKALGAGLAVGMARVVIGQALTEPVLADPTLVGARGGDWSLQRFDPAPGAVGAVVAGGGPWRARVRGPVRPP
jgi:4'-phosphopantetheinyl transferase